MLFTYHLLLLALLARLNRADFQINKKRMSFKESANLVAASQTQTVVNTIVVAIVGQVKKASVKAIAGVSPALLSEINKG